MEQLKVVGTENNRLVLTSSSGERFSVVIDEVLRAQLRRPQRETDPTAPRPSPKEIQAHIRAGLSAEEVADLLGLRVEQVQRFEHPVLAEREYIVGQALAVPVLLSHDLVTDANATFGTAVRAKLADVDATGERWTSWKEHDDWTVKLEFTAAGVDHDARWSFEPRRATLAPLNPDAVQLSRQGSLPEGLIPRLRAVDTAPDDSRFDSGAFGPRRLPDPEADLEAPEVPEPVSPAVTAAAINRAADPKVSSAETADLLEALRRRRGQREPAPGTGETPVAHAPVALFDALEPGYEDTAPDETEDEPGEQAAAESASPRTSGKGRTALPSWDEIVFGARGED